MSITHRKEQELQALGCDCRLESKAVLKLIRKLLDSHVSLKSLKGQKAGERPLDEQFGGYIIALGLMSISKQGALNGLEFLYAAIGLFSDARRSQVRWRCRSKRGVIRKAERCGLVSRTLAMVFFLAGTSLLGGYAVPSSSTPDCPRTSQRSPCTSSSSASSSGAAVRRRHLAPWPASTATAARSESTA